ncbi:MAG: allantoate amidohydrolase [Ancrocorticia sp.]
MSVTELLASIKDIGRDEATGGYYRPVFSPAEQELRAWFLAEAAKRDLNTEVDRNGVIWAWWGTPQPGSIVTGSHLDSVPGGGAYDGPLGVTAALAAVDLMRAEGFTPNKSLAVVVFPEEEGSRFGIACLGSRLMTGKLSPETARALTDSEGNTLADVFARGGIDPDGIGRDETALSRIGRFIELHIEQGRELIDLGQPIAVAKSILGHGRWRVTVRGQGNHAGTTLMRDRRDPLVAAAAMVCEVQARALEIESARATVGRFEPVPGGTNVIASDVSFWIDARHPDDDVTRALVDRLAATFPSIAAEQGCTVEVREESWSSRVDFDADVAADLQAALGGNIPALHTGAGHDAGILSEFVPTGMLFTRNPTGVSHAPDEGAEDADADYSGVALAQVLKAALS